MNTRNSLFALVVFTVLAWACKKSIVGSTDLYNDLNKGVVVSSGQQPDSATIEGLHRFVFYPKCATNGCHDGHFEPDFRTIQSAWYTLVRATPVKKQSPYTFRVTPYDTGQSWMWHRVTTTDQTLGRMPLYDNALDDASLNAIKKWILKGAPDMFGQIMTAENNNPQLYSLAVLNSVDSFRYDTSRYISKDYGPIKVPANTSIDIWLTVYDDSTLFYLIPYSKLYISKKIDDFSNATKVDAPMQTKYLFIPKFYNQLYDGYFTAKVTLNTGNYTSGDILYLRYESNDGKHANNSMMPNFNSPFYFKSYFSLIVE